MGGERLGEYVLREQLGAGGMGTVYRAEGPDGIVAIKLLHRHLLAAPGAFKRFLREAELGSKIDHENVVRTRDVDAGELDDELTHYLIMDYVEGQTLRALLNELGSVPEALCRHITASIADALAAIHATGAVHRDLKPENVLLTPDHTVKVMDLGVAIVADEAIRLSHTGHFTGSVLYAAPEQWDSTPTPDPRSDLFSVGVVLYELATGRHPFRGSGGQGFVPPALAEVQPVGRVNPQLSPFFEELTASLMAVDPADRLQSAAALGQIVRDAENSSWWQQRAPELRKAARRPLRRIRIPRETPLFGRDDEIATLQAAYDRARDGEGQVLLIEGEAGIGKSRLVDEFVGGLERAGEDVNFLFGSYAPGGGATAAGAFSTAYREHFGAEELEDTLSVPLRTTAGLIPAFAALLRGIAPPDGTAPLDTSAMQTAFVQATRALAHERPTILLIDDLHFAPGEGRALFAALALAVPGDRVLLVGTARRGLPDDWVSSLERPDHVARVKLDRLGPRALAKLLADAFQSESLARQLTFQIAAKSDGNPFFVFEILQDLRRRGVLKQREGRWSTTETVTDIAVPSTVVDLVQARLATLDEDDRDLLDVAACLGFEFDPSLVAEATGAPLLPTLKRFARIESNQRIVRASGRLYAFDHHQVQEALYAKLFPQIREQYHQAIADAMVKRGEKRPVEICEHLFAGRAGERVKPYVGDAVHELRAGHLYGGAARLARRALDVEGLYEGEARITLLQRTASWFERSGHYDLEVAQTNEAHALALALGDKTLIARTTRSQAMRVMRDGRYEDALAMALQAREMAREAGAETAVATAASTAGNSLLWLGRPDEALTLYEESLAIHLRLRPVSALVDLGNIARALAMRGERDAAIEKTREALRLAREHGVVWATATLCGNLGAELIAKGNLAEALAYLDEALSLCEQMGNRRAQGVAQINVAGIHELLGNFDRAKDWAERSIDLQHEIGATREETYGWFRVARVRAKEGDREQAYDAAQHGLRLRRDLNYGAGMAEALIDTALVAKTEAETEQLLDEAVAQAAAQGQQAFLWLAQAYRRQRKLPALPDMGPGDPAGAETGHRVEGHWALYQATKDDAHKAAAREALEYLRDHAPEEFRESMLQRVPVFRDVMA